MKLTIERAALLKALAHVQSVVERRNTIPILSNVLITAQKGRESPYQWCGDFSLDPSRGNLQGRAHYLFGIALAISVA